jgi:integrase
MAKEIGKLTAVGVKALKEPGRYSDGGNLYVVVSKHCKPIARLPVNEIDTRGVLGVLKPLWAQAPAVAMRLRGYIENVLSGAKAIGDIDDHKANPARWRDHLKHLLPERSKKSRHFAAMPYDRIPAFVVDLRGRRFSEEGSIHVPAYALEFTIVTAVRAGEALGCRWDEIDIQARTWTLPEERMKTGRMFEVPLSEAAVAIIEAMRAIKVEHCPFVFPGRFRSTPGSSKAFERLLKQLKKPFTTHGFRSAFRDWAGNETATPRDVCEMALAHKVGDMTEQAYRRSDALAKRRKLMDAWAVFLSGPTADNVVPFKTQA